jgi:hypothetical protein
VVYLRFFVALLQLPHSVCNVGTAHDCIATCP